MPDRSLNRKASPLIHEVGHLVLPEPGVIHLDNGIPVYVMDFPGHEILKIEVVYRAGRPEEDKHLASRATARLVREGTVSQTGAEIAEHIDFYGGSLHIPTNLDTANFLLFALHKYAAELIPVFAGLFQEPIFPADELETFKRTSIQELMVDLDKEEVLAYRRITELIYGENHPYGYNSTPADYAALNRDDLICHFNHWYTPANCRIFVSGRVDAPVLQLLNQHFGQTQRQGRLLDSPPQIADYQPKKEHIKHAGSLQTAIKIGRRLFSRQHPDYNGVYVLNTILGGYFGSRLMMNVREKRGYTYNIYSTADSMLYAGCLYVATEVHTGKAGATIREIFSEMKRLRDTPVSTEELAMVRNYLLGMLLNGLDGPLNTSDVVKTLITEDLPLQAFDALVHTIRTITPEQLLELANRYLQPEDFWTVTVGK